MQKTQWSSGQERSQAQGPQALKGEVQPRHSRDSAGAPGVFGQGVSGGFRVKAGRLIFCVDEVKNIHDSRFIQTWENVFWGLSQAFFLKANGSYPARHKTPPKTGQLGDKSQKKQPGLGAKQSRHPIQTPNAGPLSPGEVPAPSKRGGGGPLSLTHWPVRVGDCHSHPTFCEIPKTPNSSWTFWEKVCQEVGSSTTTTTTGSI